MNTFNRKSLYAALAGLSALGATGAAEAVNLSADGLGQVLIYPYYTVRNGPQGFPYNTLLTVVNTTLSAKAVKVRFLEGKNSKEVLDFNLFLSKNDVWTAAIVSTDEGAGVISTDTSCILPAQLPTTAPGQKFVNFLYAGDGGGDSLDRTREGYVEIIEMATFADGSTTQINITHVGGTPPGCAKQDDTQAFLDRRPGNGGLMGTMTIYSVIEGSAYSQNATAIDNFNKAAAIYFPAGDTQPDLTKASPPVSIVINAKDGSATRSDWGLTPVNAVSAVLMHDAVVNEYVTDPTILGATDWVVTMPTKNQYVKVGTGAAVPPFQRNFNGSAGACDDVTLGTWDREERSPSTPGGFSPPPPAGKASSLCWEANVITFQPTSVLGSTNTRLANLNTAQNQINGWARLGFLNTNALLVSTNTVVMDLFNVTQSGIVTGTYVGLPTIGFAVQVYQNPAIVVNGTAILSNYGSDYAHRYNSLIVTGAAP